MKLIDADKFYSDLIEEYPQLINGFGSKINTFIDNVKCVLDKQPIAFDIDSVIDKLKQSAHNTESTYDMDGYSNDDEYSVIDYDDVMEIIRNELNKEN